MIPKIIHQMGPSEREKWHPYWHHCQDSWIRNHPDFEYIFWDDEKIFKLVTESYPEFADFFANLTFKICKIDFSRFFILHHYGGIYADLDMFCYKNFYDYLSNDLYLVGSWTKWEEKVQNSLMISSKENKFWMKCMNFCKYQDLSKLEGSIVDHHSLCAYILELCGPRMLGKVIDDSVTILDKHYFNPDLTQLNDDSEIITKHLLTGQWNF